MAGSAILTMKHPHNARLVAIGQSSKAEAGNIKTEVDVPLDSPPTAYSNTQGLKVDSAEVKVEEGWLENPIWATPSLDKNATLIEVKCEVLKSESNVSEIDSSFTSCIDQMEAVLPESGEKVDDERNTGHKRSRNTGGKGNKAKEKAKKVFECDQCGLSFGRKDQYTVHTYIHTGEKPYICSVCERGFSRPDCLTVHMRIHTGERPFKCDQCGKAFKTSGYRQEHMLIHGGIKPYACSYCSKRFTHSNDLVKHQRMHTGERPYPCSKCAMAFRRLETLQKHVHRKHDSESLACSNCARLFKSKGYLEMHVRSHCKKKQS